MAGDDAGVSEGDRDPGAEVECAHASACGACPLMHQRYGAQRDVKMTRLRAALKRHHLSPSGSLLEVAAAEHITSYRRRAKLVVARTDDGAVRVGLYRRHDNQHVIDIPQCQVLSPSLMELARDLRALASDPPAELACLVTPSDGESGVLSGIDARELWAPGDSAEPRPAILLTMVLVASRAAPVEELRDAARALRERFPRLVGVAASLRYESRQASSDFVPLSGATEEKDEVGEGYQLVSHTSFLHVHRQRAAALYALLRKVVSDGAGAGNCWRVLDLYGGTGAISIALAQSGHRPTLVESYPPAAALASRAAQAQRLAVEVVTGDVASVTRALASAGSNFDVVLANPPRRGLSPAAREAVASLRPQMLVYVACDLRNMSRDLDHFARLGYRLRDAHPLDMLPLTEEVEVVAVLERGEVPPPVLLYEDDEVVMLDKPPHEPMHPQPEFPGSLVGRARNIVEGGDWVTVLKIEAGTSGVTIFAGDEATAVRWRESLESTGRLVYIVAARGVTPAKGAISRELRDEEGTRPARTRYRRLAIGGGHSILRVVPEKRHVHQIRRHLAAIGHPVLGDARYGHGPTNRYFEEKHGLDRGFLHLVRVELDHPTSGRRMLIEAPLPADLRAALVRASDESVLAFLKNKKALGQAGARFRDGGPASMPGSERNPSGAGLESDPGAAYPSNRGVPVSVRGRGALELDDAPRTVRGELLTPDDD